MSVLKLKWGSTVIADKPNFSWGSSWEFIGCTLQDCHKHAHHPNPSECHVRGTCSSSPSADCCWTGEGFLLLGSRMSTIISQNLSKVCSVFVLYFQLAAFFSNVYPGAGKFPYRKTVWKASWKTFITINNYSHSLSAFLYSFKAIKIFPINLWPFWEINPYPGNSAEHNLSLNLFSFHKNWKYLYVVELRVCVLNISNDQQEYRVLSVKQCEVHTFCHIAMKATLKGQHERN